MKVNIKQKVEATQIRFHQLYTLILNIKSLLIIKTMFGKKIQQRNKFTEGKWTRAQNDRFFKALELHGKNWGLVQKKVKTRNIVQVRSHAQKVFQNMSKEDVEALIGMEEEQTEEPDFIQSQVGFNKRDRCCQKLKRAQKKEQTGISLFEILKDEVEKSSEEDSQERNEKRNRQISEEDGLQLSMGSMFGKMFMENLIYFENGGNFMFLTPSFQGNEINFHTIQENEEKQHSTITIE